MNDPRWQRYWRYLTNRVRGEVSEELAFHVDMRTRDLIAGGMDPTIAAAEAQRRFGDQRKVRASLEQIERRRGRRMRWAMVVEETLQDIRYGLRGLVKRPGFALGAVISLALGLATVTVVYSLVDTFLLRPLPVAHGEELVVIGERTHGLHDLVADAVGYRNFLALRGRSDLFTSVVCFTLPGATIRTSTEAQGEIAILVAGTGNYFSMLGLRPALGRFFTNVDDRRREPVLVLSDGLWRRRFGADPSVIGRSVQLNGKVFTVIGVTPAGFAGTMQVIHVDGFVPWSLLPVLEPGQNNPAAQDELNQSGEIIARRVPGATMERLRAGLDVLARDLERQYPAENQGLRFVAYPETRARPSIAVADAVPAVALVFMGLAVLVLLVACANVANLVLVRASARRGELGLRQALGASRARLIRQLLTESVVLALGGLGLGWVFARAGIHWLASLQFGTVIPLRVGVSPDWRVLAFAAAGAVAAGLVVGIFPAFTVTRHGLRAATQEGARGIGGGNRHRNVLVALQLAVSLVALVAAGLFTQSIRQAAQLDLGFRPNGVLKVGIMPSLAGYDDAKAMILFDRLEARVRLLPGVEHFAWGSTLPLQAFNNTILEAYVDSPTLQNAKQDHVRLLSSYVSSEYFGAMGIPLLRGRAFTPRDDSLAPRVVIVNAAAAKYFWPGSEAIGHVIRSSRTGPPIEVVGVVKDGKYVFLNESPRPFVFLPATQDNVGGRTLILKTKTADPTALIPGLRTAIAAVDPNLAPIDLMTMTQHITGSIAFLMLRLAAQLAGAIGLLAIIQAALGLYGVVAYSVAQRSREIGIRMALGAEPGRVLRLVVAQGGRLISIGLGIGIVVALAASQLMRGFLVGVRAVDPLTFGGAIGVLCLVALVAVYLPARRAARLDPVKALRADG